jgi:hypothetical protein
MIYSYLFFASSTPILKEIEQSHLLPLWPFNFADINLLQLLVLPSG